jgi:hypothetical protein
MMELFRMEAESHTATLSAGLVSLDGTGRPEMIEAPDARGPLASRGARSSGSTPRSGRVRDETGFCRGPERTLVLQPVHVDILLRGVDLLVQVAARSIRIWRAWQAGHAAQVDAPWRT